MAAQNQGLTDLNASIASLTGVATSAVTFIQGLQTSVAALQAQLAAGTEVTDAQLETLAQSANAAIAEINTAITPSTPAPAVKSA